MFIITPQSDHWSIITVSQPGGKARTVDRFDLAPDSDRRLRLEQWLKSRRQDKDIWLCLPRSAVFQKQARLPSQDEEEIQAMARTHALSWWPFPVDSYTCHADVLNRDSEGYSDVQVTMIPRPLIEDVVTALPRGYVLRRVALSADALAASVDDGGAGALVIAAGPDQWEWCAARDRRPAASMGYHESPFVPSARVAAPLRRALDEFFSGATRPRVILFSFVEERLAAALASRLSEVLGIPVETAVPAGAKDLEGLDDETRRQAEANTPALLAARVPAKAWRMNFLPPSVRDAQQRRQSRREWTRAALTAGITALLSGAVLLKPFISDVMALQDVKAQRYQLQPRVKAARRQMDELSALQKHHERHQPLTPMLAAIYRTLPGEMWLQSLQIDAAGRLTLNGQCENAARINQWHQTLLRSSDWDDVTLGQMSKRRQFNRELMTFTMSARWKAAEDHHD